VRQQPAAVIAKALAPNLDRPPRDGRLQAEPAQGARRVTGQIHAGPGRPPPALALDHLGNDTDVHQRARQRQAGDAATDDQHAHPARHLIARTARAVTST
jgi:hypothetical protein